MVLPPADNRPTDNAHVPTGVPGKKEAFLAGLKFSAKVVALGVSAPVLLPLGLIWAGGHAAWARNASVFRADMRILWTPVNSIKEDAVVLDLYLRNIGRANIPASTMDVQSTTAAIKKFLVLTEKQKFLSELDSAIEVLNGVEKQPKLLHEQKKRIENACIVYCGSNKERISELFKDPEMRAKFNAFSQACLEYERKMQQPDLFQTKQARMMLSVFVRPENIAAGRFTGAELRMNARSPEVYLRVFAMMQEYGVVEKIPITDRTTVADVIKKIAELKSDGLVASDALGYMAQSLATAQTTLSDPMIQAFHSRVQQQADDERVLDNISQVLMAGKSDGTRALAKTVATTKAATLATEIMGRTERSEYRDVGVMLHGGWRYTKGGAHTGHYVGVEVRKVGEKYQFVIANAGSGVEHHDMTSDERARTIKIYEVDSKERAQEIVREMILLIATPASHHHSSQAKEFYGLFSAAKPLSVAHIPDRPLQKGGNCTIRNQKELMFYILQRNDKAKLANALQKHLTAQASSQVSYPAIAEELNKQGTKEAVLPLQLRR